MKKRNLDEAAGIFMDARAVVNGFIDEIHALQADYRRICDEAGIPYEEQSLADRLREAKENAKNAKEKAAGFAKSKAAGLKKGKKDPPTSEEEAARGGGGGGEDGDGDGGDGGSSGSSGSSGRAKGAHATGAKALFPPIVGDSANAHDATALRKGPPKKGPPKGPPKKRAGSIVKVV